MMNWKKGLVLLTVLALCLSLFSAFAAEETVSEQTVAPGTEETGDADEQLREKNIIFYTIDNDDILKLKAADFEKAALGITGENLSYITFIIPSATYGQLWYDYDGTKEAKVTAGVKYYRSMSSASYKGIADISYAPRSTYAGEFDIEYSGYTTGKTSFNGVIRITVNQSVNKGDLDKITYAVEAGEKFKFDASDINKACRNAGFSLSYITFVLPSSSDGVLYYNYKSSASEGTKVKAATKYYRTSSSSSAALIENVTFVISKSADKDIELSYKAYDIDGEDYTGIIRFRFDKNDYDISYTVTGESVAFNPSDFNAVCLGETGAKLSYVKFTLPSKGTLYYDYDNEESDRAPVKSSYKYYYNKSPYLYLISYIPKTNDNDTVSIDYTGYNIDGDEYNGTVTIRVKTTSLSEANDIVYSVKNTSYKIFNPNDFNNVCSKATGATLDYVKFSLPSSGTLYYNYTSSGSYDHKVSSSDKYYRSSQNYIKNVSYVPRSGSSGTVTISYTGYSTQGDRFSGKVKIKITTATTTTTTTTKEDEAEDITYTVEEKGEAMTFSAADFNRACKDVLGDTLEYVRFVIPPTSTGKLWYDYEGRDEMVLKTTTRCYYRDETPLLSDISFVPAKSGTLTLSYTAYSVEDEHFKGDVVIKVGTSGKKRGNIENFSKSKSYKTELFTDIDEDAWYGANETGAVKLAYRYALMEGKGNKLFDPLGNITVAEAVTIAARIADIYYGDDTDFEKGKTWYEPYVDYAVQRGIIDEDDFNNYNAVITRAQMAYIFDNILPEDDMEAINKITSLPDVDRYDPYYEEILNLYNAGIFSGNDAKGTFTPNNAITRAEVSAIIVRIVDANERRTNKF